MTNSVDEIKTYSQLLVAPHSLKHSLLKLIDEEIAYHKEFNNGEIILKFNSLTDLQLIEALVSASKAGVKIKMIIRGITCLIPGIENETENIEIHTIVGRYLEHSRYFYFNHNGEEKMYISSADWMTRNMERRIEVATPILDVNNKQKIKKLIQLHLDDSENTYILNNKVEYVKVHSDHPTNIHQDLYTVIKEQFTKTNNKSNNKENWFLRLFK